MKPTMPKASWTVWTTDKTYPSFVDQPPGWMWAAYGPRGSENGVETTADAATAKAYAASMLLADPRDIA